MRFKVRRCRTSGLARIELLAVGKELLIGRTLDTNAHWMGKRLAAMGGMVKQMTTVDDDLGEISSAVRECLSRKPDVLVVMGGLGPTPDDMTLKGVAIGLGRRMVRNKEALRIILAHYARRGMPKVKMTPARRKMATLPAGAEPLLNGVGTAPGVRIAAGRSLVFCLPGVPSEMKSIFRSSVEPEIEKRIGRLYTKALRFKVEGILESNLAPLISRELNRYPGTYIKSHPRGIQEGISRIELDIVSVKGDRQEAEKVGMKVADEMIDAIGKLGGKAIRARSIIAGGR
jgi:nicotinamide-nucleotide amidase